MSASLMLMVLLAGAAAAPAAPHEFHARLDRLFGGHAGVLLFTSEGVEFRTRSTEDVRQWSYQDIKQLRLSAHAVEIETFEDGGRLQFGADKRYEFRLDEELGPETAALVLANAGRRVRTAVPPPLPCCPEAELPVKAIEGWRGTQGAVRIYPEGLYFDARNATHSRFWRYEDLFAVLAEAPARLHVTAYDGTGTKTYTFALKTPLTETWRDELWRRVNRPRPFRAPAAKN